MQRTYLIFWQPAWVLRWSVISGYDYPQQWGQSICVQYWLNAHYTPNCVSSNRKLSICIPSHTTAYPEIRTLIPWIRPAILQAWYWTLADIESSSYIGISLDYIRALFTWLRTLKVISWYHICDTYHINIWYLVYFYVFCYHLTKAQCLHNDIAASALFSKYCTTLIQIKQLWWGNVCMLTGYICKLDIPSIYALYMFCHSCSVCIINFI